VDWFEKLTGIDPDKGTGTFEAMLVTLVGVAIIVVAAYVITRRRARTAR
jgi:LPXTG-motif cell wall-anchored protein